MLIYYYYLEKMILECSSVVEVRFHFQHVPFIFFNLIFTRSPWSIHTYIYIFMDSLEYAKIQTYYFVV
jgi:hypothetical protein